MGGLTPTPPCDLVLYSAKLKVDQEFSAGSCCSLRDQQSVLPVGSFVSTLSRKEL